MAHTAPLSPGFIRFAYEGTRNPHHQIIPINFDGTPTPGVSPSILPTSDVPVSWLVGLGNYLTDAFLPQYPPTVSVGAADIYAVDSVTGVRQFIYTANVGGVGTSVEAVVPFTQAVWVFKSTVGKPIKVYCMESTYAPDARNVGTVPADGRQDMVDYILSADNIFYGQTNAYPLAFQTFTSKINDVLRRNGGFTDV